MLNNAQCAYLDGVCERWPKDFLMQVCVIVCVVVCVVVVVCCCGCMWHAW